MALMDYSMQPSTQPSFRLVSIYLRNRQSFLMRYNGVTSAANIYMVLIRLSINEIDPTVINQ